MSWPASCDVADAAAYLRLSVRQVGRLADRLRTEGATGLVHGNRGRRPANRVDEAVRAIDRRAGPHDATPASTRSTSPRPWPRPIPATPSARTIRRILARGWDPPATDPSASGPPAPARPDGPGGNAPPGRRQPRTTGSRGGGPASPSSPASTTRPGSSRAGPSATTRTRPGTSRCCARRSPLIGQSRCPPTSETGARARAGRGACQPGGGEAPAGPGTPGASRMAVGAWAAGLPRGPVRALGTVVV